MVLMSMLLLYAFAASFPQSLGVNGGLNSEMKLNSSILIENSISTRNRHRQILIPNVQPVVNTFNQMQDVLSDDLCKHCANCMERIAGGKKNHTHYILSNRHPEELYYNTQHGHFEINRNERSIRTKRNHTETNFHTETVKSKNMALTKYTNEDGKVYALKFNEINKETSKKNDAKSSCTVYSVKKTSFCGSEESELILGMRKKNKKGRKPKDKSRTTGKPRSTTAVFKKREVRIENSHVPESFMPSIEELY